MLHAHLAQLQTKNLRQRVLGVMTGTSLDGVDLCLVSFSGSLLFPSASSTNISDTIKIEKFSTLPYPAELLKLLREILSSAHQQTTVSSLLHLVCQANTMWSREVGKLINEFLRHDDPSGGDDTDNDNADDDIIVASHGQTIWHISRGSTLQIGDTEILSQVTGRVVVGNFRAADVACGGSGAPLVPFLDRFLASDAMAKHRVLGRVQHKRSESPLSSSPSPSSSSCSSSAAVGLVLLQNLGGIGNVSVVLTMEGKQDQLRPQRQHILTAFDTGPACVILNELVLSLTSTDGVCSRMLKQITDASSLTPSLFHSVSGLPTFDHDGFYSSRGKVIPQLLRRCVESKYFEVLHTWLKETDVERYLETTLVDVMNQRGGISGSNDNDNNNNNSDDDHVDVLRRVLVQIFSGRSTGREDFGSAFVSTTFLRDIIDRDILITNGVGVGVGEGDDDDDDDDRGEVNSARREKFSTPDAFLQHFCDLCATAVAFTARSISLHLELVAKFWNAYLKKFHRQILSETSEANPNPVIMLCSGGGSMHAGMMRMIEEESSFIVHRVSKLSNFVQFRTTSKMITKQSTKKHKSEDNKEVAGDESCGSFDQLDDAKEAIAFALLGHEKLCSLVCKSSCANGTNEPAATGASKKCFLGQISCPQ